MPKTSGLMVVTLFLCFVTACSSGESKGNAAESQLTVSSTIMSASEQQVFMGIVNDFEQESGIAVDVNFPGGTYERQMRIKMAANNMPDLFDTHGWAQNRYGNYIESLSEQPWADRLEPSIKNVLTDDNGKLYAYPLNQALDGISYNANILEKYNISPPSTFNEFKQALRTIDEKSNGKTTPFFIAETGTGSVNQYFGQMATTLLTTDKQHNYQEELIHGVFDWSKYKPLATDLKKMKERGWVNNNAATADGAQAAQLMAQNKIAFIFPGGAGGSFGQTVTSLNPNVQVGVIPIPSFHKNDEPVWGGGERHTLALWKDSNKKQEARELLKFFSKEENAKSMAEATAAPTGFKNVKADTYYSEYYDQYSNIAVEPYFDRAYLPSGMWTIMGLTGQELLADTMSPEEVVNKMESEFHRLRETKGITKGESLD
ncbi:ABC transporter substrate-binding protein [Salibacterium halotolerans]|uniref:Raffinose/stachyose/melibiose transport system substrate-binding protein n=1 Tax=Salibacterium halotolerans TaxID=1884432 RepID=A0A1I5KVM4_9BACI|nr:ABC transporter substrate-binding protein [Salibacterium halotolerans]SFO89115.1 raffinose/stachyose/melibiose transport system substrate-binding protein [Salibacterium halotolerans]